MEQEQLNIKTPEYVSIQFQLAGLGSRAAAQIIDVILLFLVQLCLLFGLLLLTMNDIWAVSEGVMFAVAIITSYLLIFGYFAISEYVWSGKTVGKHFLGIRVVQDNGHNVTFLSSIIRNFLRIVDVLPTAYAIGIILVFAHSKHKRLGDMAANTLVVHERRKKSKKQTPLEKYIAKKDLHQQDLVLDHFELTRFSQKDWELLKTYANRVVDMSTTEKHLLTEQVSDILLPRIEDSLSTANRSNEAWLLLLYLQLKDEWDFR